MAARYWTARIVDWKKLYYFAEPTPLGVSALTGGQRLADAEVEGQRSEGQRSEGQIGPEGESGGPRLAGSRPELEDK